MQNNKGINIHPNKVMAALKHFQSRNKTHSTEHRALSTQHFEISKSGKTTKSK